MTTPSQPAADKVTSDSETERATDEARESVRGFIERHVVPDLQPSVDAPERIWVTFDGEPMIVYWDTKPRFSTLPLTEYTRANSAAVEGLRGLVQRWRAFPVGSMQPGYITIGDIGRAKTLSEYRDDVLAIIEGSEK